MYFCALFEAKVKDRDQYNITFSGLKPGKHAYDFKISASFFEDFERSEIQGGRVAVHVEMEKDERMMVFLFSILGKVIVPCDRCNDPVELEVKGNERLVVKLGDHHEEISEEVQIIRESDNKFDLQPFLYEYIHLLIPFRRIHPDDELGKSTCNPDVLKKLKELSEQHTPDPRWEALNKLKDKS